MFCFIKQLTAVGVNLQDDLGPLWQMVQEARQLDGQIWKLWMTADVLHEDVFETRVFFLDEEWHPAKAVATGVPCYLHIDQQEALTIFTTVSADQHALGGLVALLSNLYGPVTMSSVEKLYEQNNDSLLVEAIELVDQKTNDEALFSFAEPRQLHELTEQYPAWTVRSVSTIVDESLEFVSVRTMQIDRGANRVSFSVDLRTGESQGFGESQSERGVLNNLFSLADSAFNGMVLGGMIPA